MKLSKERRAELKALAVEGGSATFERLIAINARCAMSVLDALSDIEELEGELLLALGRAREAEKSADAERKRADYIADTYSRNKDEAYAAAKLAESKLADAVKALETLGRNEPFAMHVGPEDELEYRKGYAKAALTKLKS